MKVTVNLEGLHRLSSFHRRAVLASTLCGCFCCVRTFKPKEIEEWIDARKVRVGPLPRSFTAATLKRMKYRKIGQTALCPNCRVDAVLPSAFGFKPTKRLLAAMCARWFTGISDRKFTGFRTALGRLNLGQRGRAAP